MRLRPQDLRGATSRTPGTQAISAFTIPEAAAANKAPVDIDLLDFRPLIGPLNQMAKQNQEKNNEALREAGRAFAQGQKEGKAPSEVLKQLTESGRTPEQVKKYLQKLVDSGKMEESDNPAFLLGMQERIGENAHDAYRSNAIAYVESGAYTEWYASAEFGKQDEVDAKVLADLKERFGGPLDGLGFYAAMAADPKLMDTNSRLLDAAATLGRERKSADYRRSSASFIRERADDIAAAYLDGDEETENEALKQLGERFDADSLVLKDQGAIEVLEKSIAKSFRRLAMNPAVGPAAAGEALEDTILGVKNSRGQLILETTDNSSLWRLREELQLQGERDGMTARQDAEREEKDKFKQVDDIFYNLLSEAASQGNRHLINVQNTIIDIVEEGGMKALVDLGFLEADYLPEDFDIDDAWVQQNIRRYLDDRVGQFRQKTLDARARKADEVENEILGLGYTESPEAAFDRLRAMRNEGVITASEYSDIDARARKTLTKDNTASWQLMSQMRVMDRLFNIVKASVAEDDDEWQGLGPISQGKLEIEMYDKVIGRFTALANSAEGRALTHDEIIKFEKEMSQALSADYPAIGDADQRQVAESQDLPSRELGRIRAIDDARAPALAFNEGKTTIGGLEAGKPTTPKSYNGLTEAVRVPLFARFDEGNKRYLNTSFMTFDFGETSVGITRNRILGFLDALDEVEEDPKVTPVMFQTAMKDAWLKTGTMSIDTFTKPAAERGADFQALLVPREGVVSYEEFDKLFEDKPGPDAATRETKQFQATAEAAALRLPSSVQEVFDARNRFAKFKNFRVEPEMLFGARFREFRDVRADEILKSVAGERFFTNRYIALYQSRVIDLLEVNNLPSDERSQRLFVEQQIRNWTD